MQTTTFLSFLKGNPMNQKIYQKQDLESSKTVPQSLEMGPLITVTWGRAIRTTWIHWKSVISKRFHEISLKKLFKVIVWPQMSKTIKMDIILKKLKCQKFRLNCSELLLQFHSNDVRSHIYYAFTHYQAATDLECFRLSQSIANRHLYDPQMTINVLIYVYYLLHVIKKIQLFCFQ